MHIAPKGTVSIIILKYKVQVIKLEKKYPGRIIYSTKDLADFMDMTSMGIHYLENHGAIRPERKENGYRQYTPDDVSNIGEIRSFERMGFSLGETLALLNSDTENIVNRLVEKERQLKRQIRILKHLQRQITNENSRSNPKIITGKIAWFPIWEYEDRQFTKDEIKILKQTDILWLKAMPYMQYCGIIQKDGSLKKGNIIPISEIPNPELYINEYVTVFSCEKWLNFSVTFTDFSRLRNDINKVISSGEYAAKEPILMAIPVFKRKNYNLVQIYVALE